MTDSDRKITEFDRKITELAATQGWAFSRGQARSLGGTRKMMDGRVHNKRWDTRGSGVYVPAGMPESHLQRLWVAHLAIGPPSVISHESSAFAREFVGSPDDMIVFTVPHGTHPRPRGAKVHAIDDLWWEPAWIEEWQGLPMTSPARTAVDLGAVWSRARLRAAVDDARARGILTLDEVGVVLQAVARQGKPGMHTVARVLSDLYGKAASTSQLEQALYPILERPGMPVFRPQAPFPARVPTRRCTDALNDEALMIVEADGRPWHTRIADLKRDHDRDAEAGRFGYYSLRLLAEHIFGDPDGTAELIVDTYQTRIRQLAA